MIPTKSYTYNPLTTRSYFTIGDREDYVNSQYCSVSVRLHFEYKKCIESGGIVYFVTFTYNDNGLFSFAGRNFLNNNDIRQFCNKSIFPRHLKSHNYSFKFAFFGELGDGKGVRGVNNNPHYHALFFLHPLDGCDYFYHNEIEFLKLCHVSWNQDPFSFGKEYKLLSKGNVSYSTKGASVFDTKVFAYCSSYCIKSLSNGYNESLKLFFSKVAFVTLLNFVIQCPNPFYFSFIYPIDSSHKVLKFFGRTVMRDLIITSFFRPNYDDPLLYIKDVVTYYLCKFYSISSLPDDFSFIYSSSLFDSSLFSTLMAEPFFDRFYKYLYNMHRCSYRLSITLGISGLDYIDKNFLLDVSSFPTFTSPRINLPNYYFRRLCFDCVKHNDKYLYVHNSNFDSYCRSRYSRDRFRCALLSYKHNSPAFKNTLSPELSNYLDAIPANVFVSYKAFRGLCFDVNNVPFIDSSFPWDYLTHLSFQPTKIYSLPLSLNSFRDCYLSFAFHPFFYYPYIDQLSHLYDDFVNQYTSKKIIKSSLDYHSLKLSCSYETYSP